MPEVKLSLKFQGSKEVKMLDVLFGKQDNLSFITEEAAAAIANITPLNRSKKIILDGRQLEATHVIVTDFYINDLRLSDEFLVVKHLDVDAIINHATIRKWRIKVNDEDGAIYVDPAKARLPII